MVTDIMGTKITYDTYGSGKPIICIHGWLENRKCFRYESYKNFLKDYRVISIDLPGFGGSSVPKDFTFEGISGLINGVAEELKLETFEVLGQCMGTAFALDLAVRYPEKVKKVTLVEPMLYLPWWFKILLIPKLNKGLVKAFINYKMLSGIMNKYRPIRGFRRDMQRMKSLQKVNINSALQYVKLMNDYSKYDQQERIRKIRSDVVIVSGGKTFRQVKKSIKVLKEIFNDVNHIEDKEKNHFIFFP